MILYLRVFDNNSLLTLFEALSEVRWEPGFVTYQWLLASITTSNNIFIGVSMLFMWGLLIYALKRVISFNDVPLIIFGYLSLFYFYNFSMNVVRQGFAAPLILLMIVYLGNKHYWKAMGIFLVALLFHTSAFIAVILLFIKKMNLSLKFLCAIFGISSLLMLTGINQNLMSGVATIIGGSIENSVTLYSSESMKSRYGGSVNRLDFLLFTTIWIIWALWFRNRFLKTDMFYNWLLKSYLGLSSVYILFGFIGYSDRMAAYAWFLIPILLFYPAIKMRSSNRRFWIIATMVISVVLFLYFDVFSLYKPLKLLY